MDQFVVSARKYRPDVFGTVVGQESITNTLKNAIKNNHLAQAFLFCGPRGVGKTTCARILAKTINCEHISGNTEACNQCETCLNIQQGKSLNIYELDAASNNSVDDIRQLIDQVRFAPQSGAYKVYIIDEVHMLSQAAFNAFLKTLEEPPAHAIFILATTEKHKIIPTILSRCQIFDFNRISVTDIADHLQAIADKENITAEPDALHIIAEKADGALRDALSIFDQIVSFSGKKITYQEVIRNLNILDYDYYFKITDALLGCNISAGLLLFDEILKKGFDGHNFIAGLAQHLRNLLVCKDPSTLQLLETGENISQRYKEQSGQCEESFLLSALHIASKADIHYKTSKNPRLLTELMLMQLSSIKKPPVEKKNEEPVIIKHERHVSKEQPEKKEVPSPDKNPPPAQLSNVEEKPEEEAPSNKVTPEETTVTEKTADKQQLEDTPPVYQQEKPKANKRLLNQEGKKLRTASISINPVQNNISKVNEPENEGFTVKEKNEFDQEMLLETWKKFAENLKDNGKESLYTTLTTNEPRLKENFLIEMKVENSFENNNLEEIKTDLLGFLKTSLKNNAIEIKTVVHATKLEERKPYTSLEKYKKMTEKNPNLEKFKQQLNLDIEH